MVTRRAGSASSPFIRLLALLVSLGLLAAACGGDDGGGDDTGATADGDTPTTAARDEGEPQQGGSITVGLEAETANWLPSTGNWASSGYNVAYTLYDPLMAGSEGGEVLPFLAESLEPNDDLTEWQLTLRGGVTFHDGTPLNAEAIAHNLGINKGETSVLSGALASVETFEVTGELTGTYRLSEGSAAFPDRLTSAAGMPFSPTAYDADTDGFADNPVGTGPYQFVSWSRDDRLVVERYDGYWQEGLPYLDEITFRPIPDEDTRLQSLLSGDVEAMTTLRQSIVRQALDAEEQGTIETTLFIGNNGGGAIYNVNKPPVDDARVRLGLAHALDQEGLVDVLGGTGITPPQTQYFSPNSPFFSEAVDEAWPKLDEDRSRELLDEYVNDPERSDGKAVGAPISVEFNCPPDPSLIELAQAYQAFWTNVGVEVSLNQVEQAVHIQNAFAEDYMINCWRMGGEADPYNVLNDAFGSTENPLNFTNYTNPVINENLEILRTETDPDTRFEAAEAIMLHFAEAVPNLWTGGTATVIATIPEINNVGGWTLPDGTRGTGTPDAVTRWGAVWIDQ
ncbi:MAG TPA: ABC transporter substrate-binding protein [Acidimicrobiales bacterium]|nr:ABC transporter substrate-binding protein [Acidimicrobiales bacterium]